MIEVLNHPKTKLIDPPLAPAPIKRKYNPKRKLTSLYVREDNRYEIDCISLNNWTVMQFSHPYLGDVFFERETAEFIQSTKPVDEHYFKHLKRAINQWKSQFSNH